LSGVMTGARPAPAAAVTGFSVAPLSLDFGSHVLDTTTAGIITLTNGDQPQALGQTSLDWTNPDAANPFSIRPDSGCTALSTIPADSTCDLTIDFLPRTAGPWSTGLLWYIGAGAPTGVPISGVGTPTTAVTWSGRHFIRDRAWTFGNALAKSTRTSPSRSYLHTQLTTDYFGGHYASDTGTKLGVFYRRSSNGGLTWTTPVRVSPSTKHADRGAIAAYGSRVYVAYVTQTKWVHYSHTAARVMYVRTNTSYGSSGSWSTARRLSSLTGRVDKPSIATYSRHVYVAYTNASTGTIKVAISHDRGVTWTTRALGSTTNSSSDGKTGAPSVSTYGSLIVVAWTADVDGKVVARVSTNAGATWSSATLATSAASYVTAGAASGRASVAWTTATGLTVRTWRSSGWGPEVAVAPPGGPDKYTWHITPAIALRGAGQTGVGWSACHFDCATSTPALDLVWSESTDGGATFPHRQVVVTATSSSENWNPSVVWRSSTTRSMLYSMDSFDGGNYSLNIRTGSGAP